MSTSEDQRAKWAEMRKPRVRLVGEDGNAIAIIGRVGRAARLAGWPLVERVALSAAMTSGDYDHLLHTAATYCEQIGVDPCDGCADEDCDGTCYQRRLPGA